MVVLLEPIRHQGIGLPVEILCDNLADRPSIALETNREVTLGSNRTTMINAQLPDNVVKLRLEPNQTVRVTAVEGAGFVSVNGRLIGGRATCILDSGDVISLRAPERPYDYKVVVTAQKHSTPAPTPTKLVAATSDAVTSTSTASGTSELQAISEEFACAICLDLQVQSTTLVPCGHSFCKSCVLPNDGTTATGLSAKGGPAIVCSICTATASTTVACRTVDNVIAALVASTQQVFSADDAQVYRDRMQQIAGENGSAGVAAAPAVATTGRSKPRKRNTPSKRRRGSTQRQSSRTSSHHASLPSSVAQGPLSAALAGMSANDAICID